MAWSERDRCVADPDRGRADPSVLLSPEHASGWHRGSRRRRAQRYTPTNPPGGVTVYLCAADGDGMLVSLIESNYMGFGSGSWAGRPGSCSRTAAPTSAWTPRHPNALAPRVAHPAHADAGDAAARWPRGGRPRRDGRRWPAADDGPARDRPPRPSVGLQAVVNRPRWVVATEAPGQPLGPGASRVGRVGCRGRRGPRGARPRGNAHRAAHAGDGLGAGHPAPARRLI